MPTTITERLATRVGLNGSSHSVSPTSNISAGTSAIMFVWTSGAGLIVSTVTDSKGNAWVIDKSTNTSPFGISVCRGTITAQVLTTDTITITYSGTTNANRYLWIVEVTPIRPSPLDVNIVGAGANPSQPFAGTSGTLAQAAEIAFVFVCNQQASPITFTPGSGWGRSGLSSGLPSASAQNAALEYQVTAATTALTGDGTFSRTDQVNTAVMVSYEIAGNAPVNTVPPVIAGTAIVGQVLTVTNNGTWTDDGSPTFSFQWRRNAVAIGGATASTYTIVSGDDGATITCTVTDTDSNGATGALANAIGPVVAIPTNTLAPLISGNTVLGSTLSTTNGTWTDMAAGTFAYQWTSNGFTLAGATSQTYMTQAGDIGAAIGCTVTATNAAGSASKVSSNTITPTCPQTSADAPAGMFLLLDLIGA